MMNLVVGASRAAVLSFSQTADLWGFSPRHSHLKALQEKAPPTPHTPSKKKRKIPSETQL